MHEALEMACSYMTLCTAQDVVSWLKKGQLKLCTKVYGREFAWMTFTGYIKCQTNINFNQKKSWNNTWWCWFICTSFNILHFQSNINNGLPILSNKLSRNNLLDLQIVWKYLVTSSNNWHVAVWLKLPKFWQHYIDQGSWDYVG